MTVTHHRSELILNPFGYQTNITSRTKPHSKTGPTLDQVLGRVSDQEPREQMQPNAV